MEIIVREDKRQVEIWLTRAERDDVQVKGLLKPLFAEYKSKKYLCVMYNSGDGDLFANTRDLLLRNREVIAKAMSSEETLATNSG